MSIGAVESTPARSAVDEVHPVSTTTSARHRLITELEGTIGRDAAIALVDHLPPHDGQELATRAQLELLERRLESKLESSLQRSESDQQRRTDLALFTVFLVNVWFVVLVLMAIGSR